MATTTIPWGDGSGDNIYLTYPSASGNQTVVVTSDANTGAARSKVVTFTSGVGNVIQNLTVNQAGGVVGVPYIRNTDVGAYIDTGITADNTTRVVVWARNVNPRGGNLFGSRISVTSNGFGLLLPTANAIVGGIRVISGSVSSAQYTGDMFPKLSHYHKYELDGNILKIDDEVIYTGSSKTWSNSLPIHLFGVNEDGSHVNQALPVDICAVKIYKGGTLVRDYTPVNTPSIGLYDAVSDTIFTNAGSGSFTYGTFNPNAYTPLEYIVATGTQYFNTGIYGRKTTRFISAFRVTQQTNANYTLFGTRTEGVNGTYFASMTGNASAPNRYLNVWLESSTQQAIYNSSSTRLTNRDYVMTKNEDTTVNLYRNQAAAGTARTFTVSDDFVTQDAIGLAAIREAGASWSRPFYGYIYFQSFGYERNFVPAKMNDVAGLYDTYHDLFYASESGTDFGAGPEA